MQRRWATWLLSSLTMLAVSVAADEPDRASKKPAPKLETKAKIRSKTEAKAKPAASSTPKQGTATPDPRALTLFHSAESLEKAGKKPGAIALYRDVLIKYPESPEAAQAAEHLKDLGGKLPDPSEIHP